MNNAFAIGINVETFSATSQAQVTEHVLFTGVKLKFIDAYTPTFDLDNIAEVLGLAEFPRGLGKKSWEEYFSGKFGRIDSAFAKDLLSNAGSNIELVNEIKAFISEKGLYTNWTRTVLINTHGN